MCKGIKQRGCKYKKMSFVRFNCGHKVLCLKCYNEYVKGDGDIMKTYVCPWQDCRTKYAQTAFVDTDSSNFRDLRVVTIQPTRRAAVS